MGRAPARTVPLRWRTLVLLSTLAALVLANTGLTLASQARLTEQGREESTLHRTALVSQRLLRSLDGQVIEIRGYALTGEPAFLNGYAIQRLEESRLVALLRSELRGQPELLRRMDRLTAAILRWRVRVADRIVDATQEGRVPTRIEAEVDEPLFEAVRARARDLSQGIQARLDDIDAALERSRERLNRQLVISAGLALLLVAWSGWGLRRWITVPVAELTAQVRRVAAGHLQEPVRGRGPVEFQQLGDDVELMRRRIVDDLQQTRRAVEALEQNAPLVAYLRAQLQASTDVGLPPGLRIAGRLEPAEGVLAGDWYDVVSVDDQHAALIVVDVCGHGPRAGLQALWLKHLLVPALVMGLSPGDALSWVAGQMGDTGEWFATCVIVEIEAGTGRCRYANAGHPPPLLVGPDGVVQLEATGMLFGPLPGQRWGTAETTLGLQQMLVVYTDGITETRNAAGDEFGDERLISFFRSAVDTGPDVPAPVDSDPAAVADTVMHTVHAFGSDRLDDDATLAVVMCSPAGRDRAHPG